MKGKWNNFFLYILIFLCVLVFLFSLSGFFMAGSFSVPKFAEKDRYDFLIKLYLGGMFGYLISLWHLLKKINYKQ